MKLKPGILLALLFLSVQANSQVLISILFGKQLNSPNIEFGLNGGFNQSVYRTTRQSEPLGNFNLGFYFHFLLKNNSYLSTGIQVKSNMGASGMATYQIGNAAFDTLFQDGSITTRVNYFYMPVLFQQRLYKIVILEAGFMAGLRTKVTETFIYDDFDGEVSFKHDIRDDYTHLDAGLMGGIGIKTSKSKKSMAFGINYYYGLFDVYKNPEVSIKNSSVYLYAKIPIGATTKEELTKQ